VPRRLAKREADRGSFRSLTGDAAPQAELTDRSGAGLIRRDRTHRK
jgi:hypothetical protein